MRYQSLKTNNRVLIEKTLPDIDTYSKPSQDYGLVPRDFISS